METLTSPQKTENTDASDYQVASDVAGLKIVFVNVFFIGEPGAGNPWVLVDAGLQGSAGKIRQEAERLFGPGARPQAIVLTHGHFDHVCALAELVTEWDVPIYAHPLEMPFLRGKSHYPPPDPAVGGGAMAYLSWLFPTDSTKAGERVQPLPTDGSIPELPDWRWVHTPGHAPGHIALFRSADRVLIAGDAFTNTNQNAALAVMTQRVELHGPPAYFTIDWEAAKQSIRTLAALNPTAAGVGHGKSIRSSALPQRLETLVQQFEAQEVPKGGRYVRQPAHTDENGIVDMPAPVSYHVARAIGIGLLVGTVMYLLGSRRNEE